MRPEYRTSRLVIRAWTPGDAAARKAAVDASLDRLRPWFPWAAEDPRPVAAHAVLLAAQAADFAAGRWWGYGVWRAEGARGAGDALVGAVGVYRARQEVARPSVRELSYWLATGATGRGYATEAVGAVADAALREPGVLRLEIRIDPANAASSRVPPRVGFAVREHLVGDRTGPAGEPLDTVVWERRHAPQRLRPAVAADVPRLQAIRAAAREARPPRPELVRVADGRAAIDRGLCWVWADDDGVQGFATAHPGAGPRVWALCVDPPAQGRGVGGALLAQITDVLWALGHRVLTARARPGTRAARMYESAGWVPVGRRPDGSVEFERLL